MHRQTGSNGFSLVELLVAMACTLIISSAIYKLVGSSQTAFRREPELSARQQNIRIAMATIHRDIYAAGSNMPAFSQVFTNNLDGIGPLGPGGNNADELEIFTSGECPTLDVCNYQAGVSVSTFQALSSCFNFPTLVILANADEWGVFWAERPGPGGVASCSGGGGGAGGGGGGAGGGGGGAGGGGGGADNGHTVFPPGRAPLVNPPGGPGFDPTIMTVISVARYRIANEFDGVPSLWRSSAGGQNLPDGTSSWQLIARGVEDLQVRYQTGLGWGDTPGVVTGPDFNTVVSNVEITLSARATAPNLQGQTTSAVGDAVRGRLVTQVVPRSSLVVRQMGDLWR